MYVFSIKKQAAKEIEDLPEKIAVQIRQKIEALLINPRPWGSRKIDHDLYRLRSGHYRIIYSILESQKNVLILAVTRRNERTYKRF